MAELKAPVSAPMAGSNCVAPPASQTPESWRAGASSCKAASGTASWCPPSLSIVLLPNGDVEVSWPAWAGNYVPEQAPTVTGSPDRWDDVSPATYQTDGTRFYVTVPAPSDMRFYRLRQGCLGP